MNRRGMRLSATTAIVVVLVSAVLAGSASPAPQATSAPSVGQQNEGLDLRLGGILSQTGSLSSYGPSWAQAAKFAVAEIQQTLRRLGLQNRYSVSLRIEDDQSQAAAGVEAATKLIKVNKVQVIIGSDLTSVTLPVAQSVTIPNGILHIAVNGAGAKLRSLKDKNLVWTSTGDEVMVSRAMAALVAERLGQRATVNLVGENEEYGIAVTREFEKVWRARGGRIGAKILLDPKAPSYDTEAQRIVSGDPDGWNFSLLPPTAARLFPALIRTGQWDTRKTVINEALRNGEELEKIGGAQLNGLMGHTPTSVGAPARAALDALFKKQAPRFRLHGYEGTSFDAVMLAFLASVKAKSTNPASIKRQLRAISGPPGKKYTFRQLGAAIRDLQAGKDINYEGAFGSVDWDPKGNISPPWRYERWIYQNGETPTTRTFLVR